MNFDSMRTAYEGTVLHPEIHLYDGYASTGAVVPYVVQRALITTPEDISLAGNAIDWMQQWMFYCCGASVAASYNLAADLILGLQGARLNADGGTLVASIGYSGAQVADHFETAVTVQLTRGDES